MLRQAGSPALLGEAFQHLKAGEMRGVRVVVKATFIRGLKEEPLINKRQHVSATLFSPHHLKAAVQGGARSHLGAAGSSWEVSAAGSSC